MFIVGFLVGLGVGLGVGIYLHYKFGIGVASSKLRPRL
jgi:hypothetical protein